LFCSTNPCSVQQIKDPLDLIYEWDADVMNSAWDPQKTLNKLTKYRKLMVCDSLLDQSICAGVGNIIKNEVLFRIRLHPESLIEKNTC
jgi:endonuclease-8